MAAVAASSVELRTFSPLHTPPGRATPLSSVSYRRAAAPAVTSLSSRIPPPHLRCFSAAAPVELTDIRPDAAHPPERTSIRLGLPSKGRMAEETLNLLKNCQLSVRQVNPRQYVADIPQLSDLEVWFQRPKDIVRKLQSGDLDLGIVGFDTLSEYGEGSEDLIIVHDALEYGDCHLSIAIPMYGIFENVNSIDELAQMPQWTKERPLRIATGFTYLGEKFTKDKGLKYVSFSTADGALEAAPAMGIADAILDLVSSGTTLRENNLKEIEGSIVLESQAVLVARKKSLINREGVLGITHEILERLEAHLRAIGQFTVVANMRGNSEVEVAERIISQSLLSGLQIYEIVTLADELLPPLPQGTISLPISSNILIKGSVGKKAASSIYGKPDEAKDITCEVSARENLLQDQPELLQQFGIDLLPFLKQIYGSSVNGPVRHKCLSAIGKLMYFSSADMIQSLLSLTNISRCFARHTNKLILPYILV